MSKTFNANEDIYSFDLSLNEALQLFTHSSNLKTGESRPHRATAQVQFVIFILYFILLFTVDLKLPPTLAVPLQFMRAGVVHTDRCFKISQHAYRLHRFCLLVVSLLLISPQSPLGLGCHISNIFMGSRWSPQLLSYQERSSQIHEKQRGSISPPVQISRPPLNNQKEEIPGNGKNLATDLSRNRELMGSW